MTNRNKRIKIRNIGLVLMLINQVFILSGHIGSLFEEIFQRNESSVATHEIWSGYGHDANVRECPEQYCDIIVVLPHGTKIRSIERVQGQLIGASDTWHRVEHDEKTGFVFDKLVREIGNIT